MENKGFVAPREKNVKIFENFFKKVLTKFAIGDRILLLSPIDDNNRRNLSTE